MTHGTWQNSQASMLTVENKNKDIYCKKPKYGVFLVCPVFRDIPISVNHTVNTFIILHEFTFFILLLWKKMLKFMFVEFLGIWGLKFDSILWPQCELQMSSDQVWTCRFQIRYISSCISFNGAFVLPSSSAFPCIKLLSGYPELTLVMGFSIGLCKIW